ncbi:MAG TPA: TIGR00269 family protein [Candidatus Nanoarchaeia archaeon]|nr:TIGR00269 family protein [Candidatus Nanoarchaeia archaeon]
MRCSQCKETAIIDSDNSYCKEHFVEHFESTVKNTIERFNLLLLEQKIGVAASGGKDSTVLLYLLNKWGYDIQALAIDEGIAGYRDLSLEDLKAFCFQFGIKLKIVSYQEKFNTTLDNYLSKNKAARACTVCGVWRRHLLNKESKSYDVVATGHNLDDEAQSVVMNLLKANMPVLARLGPKSGVIENKAFTPRVKPLYFIMEKETAAYSLLKGISINFVECPNSFDSFRSNVRDWLNEIESKNSGTKRNTIEWFLEELPKLKLHYGKIAGEVHSCSKCGEPSMREPCASCAQLRIVVNV